MISICCLFQVVMKVIGHHSPTLLTLDMGKPSSVHHGTILAATISGYDEYLILVQSHYGCIGKNWPHFIFVCVCIQSITKIGIFLILWKLVNELFYNKWVFLFSFYILYSTFLKCEVKKIRSLMSVFYSPFFDGKIQFLLFGLLIRKYILCCLRPSSQCFVTNLIQPC